MSRGRTRPNRHNQPGDRERAMQILEALLASHVNAIDGALGG